MKEKNNQQKNQKLGSLASKSETAKNEEEVLEFWRQAKIFQKSVQKDAPQGDFVFYDGPPFATGLPHYGHILAGTIKDAVPRYQTMLGKKVRRKWGWDCHGLPLENLVEEELNLKTKKDIEDYGIEKFNEAANSRVLYYANDWEKIIPRMGRWVDMKNPYRTMDTNYTESVWWSFKEIFKKGLIYEGFKSMHYCPRCGTTLSNFEVNQGYKDIKDLSVIAKFELDPIRTNGLKKPTSNRASEPGTFVLAWTTTPWTLPGNTALAINKDIVYSKFQITNSKTQTNLPAGEAGSNDQNPKFTTDEFYIIAKERLADVLKDDEYKIIKEFKGSDLIGKKYKPVFDYYLDEEFENKENAWKIYGADFVNMEEGTGIIHIAPAFGADDLDLARKENIPVVQNVNLEGKFKPEVRDFAGLPVKPKGNHQSTDIEIIKYLAGKNLLFAKEKIEHSYPHCWRCETPLLNYATSSWFLKTIAIKDEIIAENKKIKWVPSDIRDGRFGKWLEGMRDWAISRSRYWGAPLPVWKCAECGETKIIGSVEEIKKEIKENSSQNRYFTIRHGEAENNILQVCSKNKNDGYHLTEGGKEQIKKSAQELKNKGIDLIISSPYIRAKESAEILAKELDTPKIVEDDRIQEINNGALGGKSCSEYRAFFENDGEKFTKTPDQGENFNEIKKRTGEFLSDIDKKYSQKNILIVAHENILWLLEAAGQALNVQETVRLKKQKGLPANAQWQEIDFTLLPHNRNYELDLHKPYIDEIEFDCDCGGKMKIIGEVFDCWYESGSMPFASKHYPFENLEIFNPEKNIGFPADFIAEGLDQTRGWFYSTLVLAAALFGKTPYQTVIVNGMVLAEDGQKMSKSKNNFPDPLVIVDKYGSDALRYYLLSSPLMKAEDLSFSEKGVDEILKKIILRFKNVYSFYELYEGTKTAAVDLRKSPNVLDKWILARLGELTGAVEKNMDNYELDKATRPISDFIDDLSTWYLRRSRDRFKGGDEEDRNFAIATTKYVLENLAKVFAPFMPFVAEEIWQKVTGNNFEDENKSAHLEKWPSFAPFSAEATKGKKVTEGRPTFGRETSKSILEEMEEVRKIVSLGLETRAKAGVKVRQPLFKLKVNPVKFKSLTGQENEKLKRKEGLLELVKDELNVKEIVFDAKIENEVELDLEITPELQAEGDFREFLRNVQKFRKEEKLTPQDIINLIVETDEKGKNLIEKFASELKKTAGIKDIQFTSAPAGREIKINNLIFKIKIV
ncbi:MAG: class I tRNA ligase family protein [Candidatus Pacebacteria bacterium]|nr:class I tRNA ligase family protein [Candidatus Paceibacterota bacterium]